MPSEHDNTGLGAHEIGRIFREGSGRAVAALIRVFGDIDVAEDAVQDAFAIAMEKWPASGPPPNPTAWIITTARNRALDRLRRETLGRAILGDVVRDRLQEHEPDGESPDPLDDDLLRLIFTCCHPALAPDAQVALTLRLLGGLETAEVARAFLVQEATMAQRIVRAKRKIKESHIPYRVPEATDLPKRIPPVLAVVYLIFSEGAYQTQQVHSKAGDLCAEALRLARLLCELLPGEMEAQGLLSLLLFNDSRKQTRFDSEGALVLLRDQRRCDWNRLQIAEARDLMRDCLAHNRPGPYQLQASIQAVHTDAEAADNTDWPQIVAIYDQLLEQNQSPVVALNRAIAVAEVEGPERGLALVEPLELHGYYLYHAARGHFLRALQRPAEATAAFKQGAKLAPSEAERTLLRSMATEE